MESPTALFFPTLGAVPDGLPFQAQGGVVVHEEIARALEFAKPFVEPCRPDFGVHILEREMEPTRSRRIWRLQSFQVHLKSLFAIHGLDVGHEIVFVFDEPDVHFAVDLSSRFGGGGKTREIFPDLGDCRRDFLCEPDVFRVAVRGEGE